MADLSRRALLGGVAGLAGFALLFLKKRLGLVRPPGALPERDFLSACIRCFRCAEACPVGAITASHALHPATFETPTVVPRTSACVLCMKCTEACPTGALQVIRDDPEVIAKEVRMGRPDLNRNACITWNRSGACQLCYYACPYPDRAVRLTGFIQGPHFYPDQCVGCGQCEQVCPEEARAIRIRPLELSA